MATRRPARSGPFDTLEQTFDLLSLAPPSLALDGSAIPGLPERPLPLDELRARLLHPSASFALRNAAIGALVVRAQESAEWMVGLAGVLLPGLRRAAWPLTEAYPDRRPDIESEMLAALVAAVRQVSPQRPRLAAHLIWAAHSGAKALVRAEMAEWAGPGLNAVSAAPPRPWGHPDLVLAGAVAKGVVCAEDAELIGATRLEGVSLQVAAERLGVAYPAARKRRNRAEAALVDWLTSERYSGLSFVPNRPPSAPSHDVDGLRRGRPRERRPRERHSDPSTRR